MVNRNSQQMVVLFRRQTLVCIPPPPQRLWINCHVFHERIPYLFIRFICFLLFCSNLRLCVYVFMHLYKEHSRPGGWRYTRVLTQSSCFISGEMMYLHNNVFPLVPKYAQFIKFATFGKHFLWILVITWRNWECFCAHSTPLDLQI